MDYNINRINKILLLFTFLTLGMYLGKYTARQSQPIIDNNPDQFTKLVELLSYVETNYVNEINIDSLQEEIITKTLESLDPHSNYIPLEEIQKINESMQGNFEGIGVEFQIIEDTITVVSPIAGGPSETKGILAGDKIIKVDSLNVAGVGFTNKDVLKTLKGDKGTEVVLFIKRKNVNQLIEFKITRDKIPITSVDVSYMINSDVGYLKVNRFSSTTYKEFTDAIDKLKILGMKNIILDLRSNPGGYLSAAINMVDEFLPSGKTIVYTEGNARKKQTYTSSYYGECKKEKIVVLVDEGSASASEIVAGAIQDHERGFIIGRQTYGKGLVQEQTQLNDGSAFRLTTARYFTPSGRCIQKPYKDYKESMVLDDSIKFYTDHGRVVYGGGGISPDYFIPIDTTGGSKWLYELIATNIINSFVFDYANSNAEQLNKYVDAIDFAKNFIIDESLFITFIDVAKNKGVLGSKSEIQNSKEWICIRLKALIARQKWNEEGFYRVVHKEDEAIKKAIKLLYDT